MGRKYTSIHVFTNKEDILSVKLMKEYSAEISAILNENQEVFSFVFSNEEKLLYSWKRD